PRMHRLRVEAVAVTARDVRHARAEAADDDRRRRLRFQKPRVARPEPPYELDPLDSPPRPRFVALNRLPDGLLLGGIWCAATPAGADPEKQPAARHRLQPRRHVGGPHAGA